MFRIVIPARYASSRFPGKPLVPIAGRTMLEWVWMRARASSAAEVFIATDDPRIAQAARGFGANVEMTATTHGSGTARIAEVAARHGWPADSIVVNVQGDEPLLPPALIDQVARLLATDVEADIATLATPIAERARFVDPATVKVVTDVRGRAMYFSRAPIPCERDAAINAPPPALARRHVGLYAYRMAALGRLVAATDAAAGRLEELEKLEQLRALALGLRIAVADASVLPGPDVNTPEDLPEVTRMLAR